MKVFNKRKKFILPRLAIIFFLLMPIFLYAQLLEPFTQRTSTYSPEKKIYRIKGDYTIIGNTNCRKIGIPDYNNGIYDATQYNQNVRYVDVDTFSTTINSSTAELKFSQEEGANPECSNIVFAGLYWTGRTDDPGMIYHNHYENSVEVKRNETIAGHKLRVTLHTNDDNEITRLYQFTPLSSSDGDTIRIYFSLNKNTSYHYIIYEGDTLYVSRSRTATLPEENCIQLNDSLWITGLFRGYGYGGTLDYNNNNSLVQGQYTSCSSAMISKKPFSSYKKDEIKIKHKNAENYTVITAHRDDIHFDTDPYHDYAYAAYAEITDYVRQYGEGNYTIADLATAIGDDQNTGYFGGWGMVVVYENDLMQWKDITIFDGFADVRNSNSVHIPISGFRTLQVGDVNVKLGYIVAEGDTKNSGEQLKILRNDNNEWFDLSHDTDPLWHPLDLVHPTDSNFFQSIISGDNYKNPENEYCGLDIATFMMENPNNALITNHQTQTEFYFTTFKDVFLPICFVMGVDAYTPDAEAISSVMDIGDNVEFDDELGVYTIEPGDTINFIVDVKNIDTEDILDAKLEIPLPNTIEYYNTEVLYTDEGITTAIPYFDAERNANGTVGWDINYLKAGNPDKTLVKVKLTCKVTEDCYILSATDDECMLVLHVNGTLEGRSYINNIYFKKESFISGFVQDGPCRNNAIRNDIWVVVDKNSYNEINCSDKDYTLQEINVCNYSYSATEPIPFIEIYQLYPPGSRFFNTSTGVEYTIETGFPIDVIGETIEVIPSTYLPTSCSSELRLVNNNTDIDFSENPPTISTTSITYCIGEEAAPLSELVTLSNPSWYARFYYDTAGITNPIANTNITPSTDAVGTYKYYVRQFKENSIGCQDENFYGPITVTVVSPIEFSSDQVSPSCYGEPINITATPAGGYFSFSQELSAHIDTTNNLLTIKETMPVGEVIITYTHTDVTDPNNCEITQLTYTHQITEPTVPGILSADQTICEHSLIQPLLIEGAIGHVERWEYTTDTTTGTWHTIPNNTNSISSADLGLLGIGTYFYRALVKDGNCATKMTNTVKVEVTEGTTPPAPVVTQPQYACYDTDYEIQIPEPVNGKFSWYDHAVGGWAHDSLRIVHVTDAWVSRWVSFVDTISGCSSSRSLVSVRSNLNPGEIATTGQIACTKFEDPLTIGSLVVGTDTLHATLLNGATHNIEYRWYIQKDDGEPVLINGANQATYTPSSDIMGTEGTYIFTRYAKSSECTQWQKSMGSWKLVVGPPDASITVLSEHSTLCETSSVTLTLAASGPGTKYAYQWYKDGVAIPGAISQTYSATEVGTYSAKVTHRASGCFTYTPEEKVVKIIKDEYPPLAEDAYTSIIGCSIDDAHNTTIYTTVDAIEAALEIEIKDQISGETYTPDEQLVLTIIDSTEVVNPTEGCYQLIRTYNVADNCNQSTNFFHTITINDTTKPVIENTPISYTLTATNCEFKIPDISAAVRSISSDNCTENNMLTITQEPSAGTPIIQTEEVQEISILATITDECGNANYKNATILVPAKISVIATANPTIICTNDTAQLWATVSNAVGTPTFEWNPTIGLNNANIANPTVTLTTTNTPTTIDYSVEVTDDNGCLATATIAITVRPSILTPGNVEFSCPRDTTVMLAYNECEQFVNIGYPEFVNNMTNMNVVITNDAPTDSIFTEGTTIVTWTATDECGATLKCYQNVTVVFPPCGTPNDSVADFDGYKYSSVRIGCQCWTGENARSEHYSDGTPVNNFRYYNDNDSLENIYGKLYTWYAAAGVPEGDNNANPTISTDPLGRPYIQGICPEGWALPTIEEYMLMLASSNSAIHAKDGSNLYWLPGYEGQPPYSGFDAYGAGTYNGALNRYEGLLGTTYFWTTLNVPGAETTTTVEINYYCAEGLQTELSKGDGASIRCLRKE